MFALDEFHRRIPQDLNLRWLPRGTPMRRRDTQTYSWHTAYKSMLTWGQNRWLVGCHQDDSGLCMGKCGCGWQLAARWGQGGKHQSMWSTFSHHSFQIIFHTGYWLGSPDLKLLKMDRFPTRLGRALGTSAQLTTSPAPPLPCTQFLKHTQFHQYEWLCLNMEAIIWCNVGILLHDFCRSAQSPGLKMQCTNLVWLIDNR